MEVAFVPLFDCKGHNQVHHKRNGHSKTASIVAMAKNIRGPVIAPNTTRNRA